MRPVIWISAVLTAALASSAAAQCTVGTALPGSCGSVYYVGCCDGQDLYWCENSTLCYLDCSANPLCGWSSAGGFYDCGTGGGAAPGNNPPMACATDEDGDGYDSDTDCDDTDPSIHPGATEVCNGLDDNCDGSIPADERDNDYDGWSECEGDCDDGDPTRNPGQTEVAYDGIDQDCDGSDWNDLDGDGYPGGTSGSDCDDQDDLVHPGMAEDCNNGKDDDCDGAIDGLDSDCGGGGDDDASGDDDDADDDDFAIDDDLADDDTGPPVTQEPPQLGVSCDCAMPGAHPAGGPAAWVVFLSAAMVLRRRARS